jgi:hypothetical protein
MKRLLASSLLTLAGVFDTLLIVHLTFSVVVSVSHLAKLGRWVILEGRHAALFYLWPRRYSQPFVMLRPLSQLSSGKALHHNLSSFQSQCVGIQPVLPSCTVGFCVRHRTRYSFGLWLFIFVYLLSLTFNLLLTMQLSSITKARKALPALEFVCSSSSVPIMDWFSRLPFRHREQGWLGGI